MGNLMGEWDSMREGDSVGGGFNGVGFEGGGWGGG